MKLFNLSRNTVIAVSIFLGLLVLGMCVPMCHAAEGPFDPPYAQMSAGSTIIRGPAPVIDLTFVTPASVLRNSFWQGSITLVGQSEFKGEDVPNNMILRGLFVDGFGSLDVGFGVCWMLNPAPYNGSNVNFNLQLDYRFSKLPITLTLTHASNGGQRSPNYGRDILLLGYRFH